MNTLRTLADRLWASLPPGVDVTVDELATVLDQHLVYVEDFFDDDIDSDQYDTFVPMFVGKWSVG